MSQSTINHDEQTIFLGNGWTLSARVQRGLVENEQGHRVGADFHVLQFWLITDAQPHGVKISAEDARALLAWREMVGTGVPPTGPEKVQVRMSPPANRGTTTPNRMTAPRR